MIEKGTEIFNKVGRITGEIISRSDCNRTAFDIVLTGVCDNIPHHVNEAS